MAKIPGSEFWDDEKKRLWEELSSYLILLIHAGGESGYEALPEAVKLLMNWDVFNRQAVNFLREYRLSWVNDISDTTRNQAVEAISEWIEAGEPKPALDKRLSTILGPTRAESIATTEVTRVYAKGNQLAWKATRIITAQKWQTAQDERVCFPKWTMVATPEGETPIQSLSKGNLVMTRQGPKRVIGTSAREYNGKMTAVKASNDRMFISTEDHPVYSNGAWREAATLGIGDSLEFVGNESGQVIGINNFPLGKPNNMPPSIFNVSVSPAISFANVDMPVIPICFNDCFVSWNNKVDRIASSLNLLKVSERNGINGKTHSAFKRRFPLKRSITGNATKLPVTAGRISKLNAAVVASSINRGASTLFGTIMPVEVLFGMKGSAAPFTVDIFGIGRSALQTTNRVSVRDTFFDGKQFPTLRANLLNHIRRAVSIITGAGTKTALASKLDASKELSALFADFGRNIFALRKSIAFLRTIYRLVMAALSSIKGVSTKVTSVFKRHLYSILSNVTVLYHRLSGIPLVVYDIEVEDAHEFYANGVLVHNCPVCGPLHGQIVGIDDVFTQSPDDVANSQQMKDLVGGDVEARRQRASTLIRNTGAYTGGPPRHVNCRCWLLPVVSEEEVRTQRRRRLGLKAEIPDVDEFMALLREDDRVVVL